MHSSLNRQGRTVEGQNRTLLMSFPERTEARQKLKENVESREDFLHLVKILEGMCVARKDASNGGGGVAGDTQKRGEGMLEHTYANSEKGKLTTPSEMVFHWVTTEKCAWSKEESHLIR